MRAAASLCLLAIVACGGDHPRDWGRADTAAMLSDSPGAVPDTSADTLVASPANGSAELETVLAADSAVGDAIFHRRGQCFTCHGANGTGLARLGPSLRDGVWFHSDGSLAGIAGTIANGVATPLESPIVMPGFARQLSEDELHQVASYVFSLGHRGRTIQPDHDVQQVDDTLEPFGSP